jgi:hypothetical protein
LADMHRILPSPGKTKDSSFVSSHD